MKSAASNWNLIFITFVIWSVWFVWFYLYFLTGSHHLEWIWKSGEQTSRKQWIHFSIIIPQSISVFTQFICPVNHIFCKLLPHTHRRSRTDDKVWQVHINSISISSLNNPNIIQQLVNSYITTIYHLSLSQLASHHITERRFVLQLLPAAGCCV